jgi:ABC-type multidrug transport system fused ATPase/permease subunit
LSVSHNSILETVKSLKILLTKDEQKKGKKFLLYTAFVGLTDVLALVTVVPVLMLAIDGDFLAKSSKLRKIYSLLNMPNESTFLITLIVGVVIFFIFKNSLAIFIQNKLQSFCIDIVQKFTIKSFNGVISNSFIETLQKGSSDLFQKVHFNSYLYVAGIVLPFVNFIGESVVLLVVLIFIIWFNPTVFILIALFTAPAFYIINRTIKNKIYNLGLKTKGIREETIDSLNIGINGIADIKLNQSSKYFIDQFIQKQKFLLECDFKSYYYQQIPSRANCFANEHHIQLAVGRDFSDCTPVKGTFKGPANHDLMVYVSVGYEDGTTFEDENEVLMNKEETDQAPVIHIQSQQQQ